MSLTALFGQAYIVDTLGADPLSPTRKNRKGKKASNASSDGGDSDYVAGADRGGSASSIMGSADEDAMDIEEILAQLSDSTSQPRSPPKPGYKPYEDNPIFENDPFCGICGTNHLPSRCLALCDVENLRELRDYFKDGPEPEAIRVCSSSVVFAIGC